MRLSRYFLPVLKQNPAEAQIASPPLDAAGLRQFRCRKRQEFTPGRRSAFACCARIEQIVREEMDRAGAIEVLMPTLQLADLWRESGRYDDYGAEMLRITDRHERELLRPYQRGDDYRNLPRIC